MANLAKAKAGIEKVIGILRSRYRYEHPIYDYLADVLSALDEAPEAPVVEPPVAEGETTEQLKAEAEAAEVIQEAIEPLEADPPTSGQKRKRGKT